MNNHCCSELGRISPVVVTPCTAQFDVEMDGDDHADCPVPGCPARIKTRYGVRRHFNFRHPVASVNIVGDPPTDRCHACGLFVPTKDNEIPLRHHQSKYCRDGERRARDRTLAEKQTIAEQQRFYVKGIEIERVSDFSYLGRDLEETDDDTLAINNRIAKARKRWNQIHPILARKGARTRIMTRAYVAVVQAVLLFGSETWVIKDRDWKKLESFHNSCARRITQQFIFVIKMEHGRTRIAQKLCKLLAYSPIANM